MNPASRELIDTAIKHLQAAVTHDCNGEYAAALTSYLDGVPILLQAAKDPRVAAPIQDLLTEKCKQYLTRVQVIRDHLHFKKEVPPNNFVQVTSDEHLGEVFLSFSERPQPSSSWDDVCGMSQCKEFIEKNVIMPLKFPGLFDKVTKVKRGILLYGLPGVGKSCLLNGILTSVSCPFLRIPSSTLCSRYFNSESVVELVQKIFEWAKKHQPCILCFEDLDVLCHPEHNSPEIVAVKEEVTSRLQAYSSDNQVTVLGSTQSPWYLTGKLVRKFDRRFWLALPTLSDRVAIFRKEISDCKLKQRLSEEDFLHVGEKTENFTGADLTVLARDCIMEPVRKIQKATHYKKIIVTEEKNGKTTSKEMLTPCEPTELGAIEISWEFLNADRVQEPTLTMADVEKCLMKCSPSCRPEEIEKMAKWAEEFGQD